MLSQLGCESGMPRGIVPTESAAQASGHRVCLPLSISPCEKRIAARNDNPRQSTILVGPGAFSAARCHAPGVARPISGDLHSSSLCIRHHMGE